MKRMIKAAKKLKVKQINKEPSKMGDQYEVGEHIVRIFKKPGRSLITCSCEQGTMFCNSPSICKHRLAVIDYVMRSCIDCGKPIDPFKQNKVERCKSCSKKGEKNPQFGMKKEKSSKWKGGKYTSKLGYILVHCPDHPCRNIRNYVQEHRLVVEKKIGRFLKKEEIVHHIDEDKANNKIENLILFKSNSAHQKFHTKVRQFGFTNPILRQIWDPERWKKIK